MRGDAHGKLTYLKCKSEILIKLGQVQCDLAFLKMALTQFTPLVLLYVVKN